MLTPSEIIRMPAGAVYFIELADNKSETYQKVNNAIKAKCCQAGGKTKHTKINGFDQFGNPIYLLRVEVIESARPYKYKKCSICKNREQNQTRGNI